MMGITPNDIQNQREMLGRGEEISRAAEQAAERERLRDTFAAAAPRWTPADEKPPEIGRRVLGFWMAHRGTMQSVRGVVGGWLDDDGNATAPPTHWMPLPEPPEVTK